MLPPLQVLYEAAGLPEFPLPEECAGQEAEVLFEARRVRLAGKILADSFEPMARHVYRIRLR